MTDKPTKVLKLDRDISQEQIDKIKEELHKEPDKLPIIGSKINEPKICLNFFDIKMEYNEDYGMNNYDGWSFFYKGRVIVDIKERDYSPDFYPCLVEGFRRILEE